MRTDLRPLARGVLGCAAVASVLLAVVLVVGSRSDLPPSNPWRPPADYRLVDTVSLPDDRRLRLWIGDSGWYVEARRGDRHESAVGARGDGDQYSASLVLGGLLLRVPVADARTLTVRQAGTTVHGTIHAGTVLVPAPPVAVDTVLVTPLDIDGSPLGGEVAVPLPGRT